MKPLIAFCGILLGSLLSAPACLAAPQAASQAGQGYLKTKVSPGRAGVFIDGKYVGPAANFRMARKYAVPEGEHEVKLSDPRYEEAVTKVNIKAGKTTTVSQSLRPVPLAKPPFGVLRVIHADKYAAVYVNDKFFGHADEFSNSSQGLLLNPGEYTVKVAGTAGGKEHEEKAKIEANKTTVVRAE